MNDPAARRLKDTDSVETAHRLKAIMWSGAGAVLGVLAGALYAARADRPALLYIVLFGVGMWAIVYGAALFFADRAGAIGSAVYFGSGSSMPVRREYSLAESLAARGRYAEAAAEYERNVALYPDDIELYLRLARLQRDEFLRADLAAQWFTRALAVPGITKPLELLTSRELIELYLHQMKQPERALPLLARIAERHPHNPDGEWARAELAVWRRRLFPEQQDG